MLALFKRAMVSSGTKNEDSVRGLVCCSSNISFSRLRGGVNSRFCVIKCDFNGLNGADKRVTTHKIGGTDKVGRCLSYYNKSVGSTFTFNSTRGSVRVFGDMGANVTVKGTYSRLGRLTSCVATSVASSNLCGTFTRFNLV